MDEDIEGDWEKDISDTLGELTVQDNETGEIWLEDAETVACSSNFRCLGAKPKQSYRKLGFHPNLTSALPRFRVPKEYSKLGADEVDNEPSCLKPEVVWSLEPEDALLPNAEHEMKASNTIVASIPSVGRLPAFCRKRKSSTALKEPEKRQEMPTRIKCRLESFLEEQEGLLCVGRLLLFLLTLLSPGFVLPIIFTLKLYCHFQTHCHNEECPSELFPLLYGSKKKYSLIPARYMMMYQCRLCRDQRVSEKIFRLHSHLNPSIQKSRFQDTNN